MLIHKVIIKNHYLFHTNYYFSLTYPHIQFQSTNKSGLKYPNSFKEIKKGINLSFFPRLSARGVDK